MEVSRLPNKIFSLIFDNVVSKRQWYAIRTACKSFKGIIDEKISFEICSEESMNGSMEVCIIYRIGARVIGRKTVGYKDLRQEKKTWSIFQLNFTAIKVPNYDPLSLEKLVFVLSFMHGRGLDYSNMETLCVGWDGDVNADPLLEFVIPHLPKNMDIAVPVHFQEKDERYIFKRLFGLEPKRMALSMDMHHIETCKEISNSMRSTFT
ncbi:hypothetical protein QR680_006476 [Steinernema hermaphroditum]|uniref:F-box domain-containing protein n=1 Tax=Steinernema hermaphroditum TaxID=289476 RepID=A0AA39HY30_9BILA|nr:hypothetical protein QR680_006476 [Steinernema hermaphroditum]